MLSGTNYAQIRLQNDRPTQKHKHTNFTVVKDSKNYKLIWPPPKKARIMKQYQPPRTQADYNGQHNTLANIKQTAYQTLIEQVVTGERNFAKIQLPHDREVLDSERNLKLTLYLMEQRDSAGYIPSGAERDVEELTAIRDRMFPRPSGLGFLLEDMGIIEALLGSNPLDEAQYPGPEIGLPPIRSLLHGDNRRIFSECPLAPCPEPLIKPIDGTDNH